VAILGDDRFLMAFDDPWLRAFAYGGALELRHGEGYLTVADYQSDIWVMDLKREQAPKGTKHLRDNHLSSIGTSQPHGVGSSVNLVRLFPHTRATP